ncbi:MAG TPA: proline dehydrogenase family protein [Blastocatellia bacterium]|nr:proline dehydrogenase family protein [Blastocatellia bacterium]HMX29759.1 proline dehydrogenase family protein [Blastocatellia bacterium]HMY72422.1 proline dehydrogenase family protein [Blastocatellia bacterium]HMZ22731.1 proline dehydrogenase family protein [Blastocatellia bacterium]HNG32224.1 proline dehydrogenase family protein [Blastocatellia bacterium]
MISRTALLYLSQQHKLKDLFIKVPGFRQVTRRFIAGENIEAAILTIKELNKIGITATFDHLGESTTNKAEAEADVREYLRLLNRINETGVDSNASVKLTQLGLDINEDYCLENTRMIVAEAHRLGNFVRIDMEDSSKTDATLRIFKQLFKEFGNVGIVLQAYLYRTEKDVDEVLSMGARIRLCKGAYNEPAEVAFPEKSDVDANFVKLAQKLISSGIYHGIATHDLRMIRATQEFAARQGITKDKYEFQMLYGVRRDLMIQLAQEGYRIRTYVPYGEFWYPYFMRRLAERPANVWFIVKSLFHG